MISRDEIVRARDAALQAAVRYLSARSEVVGVFVAGSLPAGTADAYSDIDLRVITTPEGHSTLLAARLVSPSHWGDLLFSEWMDGTQHCISHFRPFFKIDVFYWSTDAFRPSPWLKFPATILLDRTGIVSQVLSESAELQFDTVPDTEVSRLLSKALAGAHEVVRRIRRGELIFAQSLLEELRTHMIRLDACMQAVAPGRPSDLKLEPRIRAPLLSALRQSYASLDADALETAVVALSEVLIGQISELHDTFALARSLENDLHAAELVRSRQIT
jgi:hypothetical protein